MTDMPDRDYIEDRTAPVAEARPNRNGALADPLLQGIRLDGHHKFADALTRELLKQVGV